MKDRKEVESSQPHKKLGAGDGPIPSSPVPVLIVDHDSINRAVLAWLLLDLGFYATVVDDVAAARELLAKSTPRIMILNLMLPDGIGIELLAEIRRANRPITVAVLTAVPAPSNLAELLAWKPDAIFGNPVDTGDFDEGLITRLSNFALTVWRESQGTREGQENQKSEPPPR